MDRRLALVSAIYALIAALGLFLLHSWFSHVKAESARTELRLAACGTVATLSDDFIERCASENGLPAARLEFGVERLSGFLARCAILKRVYIAVRHGDSFRYLVSSVTPDEREKGVWPRRFDLCEDSEALAEAYDSDGMLFLESGSGESRMLSAVQSLKTKGGQRFLVCATASPDALSPFSFGTFALMAGAVVFIVLLALPFLLLLAWPWRASASDSSGYIEGREAQLVHAGRLVAMGEMTAGIAHEINQPLCVIRGYLELLQAVLANEPVLKERQLEGAFDIGIKSVDKASRIINHMRSFVRLRPGDSKPVNLRVPLAEGLCFFNEQIKLHNIQLSMEFEENVPSVMIDQQKFEQIVVNLVANSRYSVDEKGERLGRSFKKLIKLKLRHDKAAGRVVLDVEDNGIGMSKEVMGKCGTLFFTTKRPGEGTGLGVSIARQIVKESGGELSFASVEGEESVFSVSFPACGKEPSARDLILS